MSPSGCLAPLPVDAAAPASVALPRVGERWRFRPSTGRRGLVTVTAVSAECVRYREPSGHGNNALTFEAFHARFAFERAPVLTLGQLAALSHCSIVEWRPRAAKPGSYAALVRMGYLDERDVGDAGTECEYRLTTAGAARAADTAALRVWRSA